MIRSLEAALWAFHDARDFRQAVLRAVNLGDDADTTGAVCGHALPAGLRESSVLPAPIVTPAGGGSIRYTPAAGFTGTETFTYTVDDGSGGSASATVTVQVRNDNAPPVATNDTVTLPANSAPTGLTVLGNDFDPNFGEGVSVVAVAPAANGTVTVAGHGAGGPRSDGGRGREARDRRAGGDS